MTNNSIRTAEKNREQVIKDYINKFMGVEYLNLDDDTKPSSPKIYDQIIYKKTETSWELAVCSGIQGSVVTWEVIERDEAWYDHLSVYFSHLYIGDSNWKKFDQFGFTKLNIPQYQIIDFTTENVGIKKVMLGWEGNTDGPILIPGDVHEGLIKLPYADKGTSTESTLNEIQIGDDLNGLKLDIHFDEINTSLETLIQNHPDYEFMSGSIYLISSERYPMPAPWSNREASWGLQIWYVKQNTDITASVQAIGVVFFNTDMGTVADDGYLLMGGIWSNDNYAGHGITYDADNHEIAFNNSFVVSEFHHNNSAITADGHLGVVDTGDLDDLKNEINKKIFLVGDLEYDDSGIIKPESDSINIDDGRLEAKISKETGNALTLKDDGLYATGGGSGGNVNFAEHVYYISTDGDDNNNDGSIDEPFKTFNGAYNKIKNDIKQPFNDIISFKFLHEGDDSETTSYIIDFSNISIYSANNFRFIGDYVNGNEDNPYEIELISRSKLIFDHGSLEIFDLNLTAPSISISNANVKFVNSSISCASTSSIMNFIDLYNSKVDYVIDSTSKGYNIDCNNKVTNAINLEGNSYFGFNNLIVNGSLYSIENEEGFIFSPATDQGKITGTARNLEPTTFCNCIGYYAAYCYHNIVKRETELLATYDKCIYKENMVITFKLREISTGSPIKGKNISYSIGGTINNYVVTDENGEGIVTYENVIQDIIIFGEFIGDEEYDGSVVETEGIYYYKTELACPPIVKTELQEVIFDIHLKKILGPNDDDYDNVVGEKIWVKYGILPAYMEYTTDEQGMVSIPYPDEVDTIIYAYYDGNDDIEKRLLGSEVISSISFNTPDLIPTKFYNETKTIHRNENIQELELFTDTETRDYIDRGTCLLRYYYDADTNNAKSFTFFMNPPRTIMFNLDSGTGLYATASKVFVNAVYVDLAVGKKYKNSDKMWAYDFIDNPIDVSLIVTPDCINNGTAQVSIWIKNKKTNEPIINEPVIVKNRNNDTNYYDPYTDDTGKVMVTLIGITEQDEFIATFNPDPSKYNPETAVFVCYNCIPPEIIDDINSDTLEIDKSDSDDTDIVSETLDVGFNTSETFSSKTFEIDKNDD